MYAKPYNGKTIKKEIYDYDIIKYKLTIGKGGLTTLRRLAVGGYQLPVEIPFIIGVCKQFKEKIKAIQGSEPTNKEIIFTNIEFNQDFKKTRLEGLTCVTLENLYFIYKIYQKGDGYRLEAKSRKGLQMTEEALIQVLGGNQNTIELYQISQDILTRLDGLEKSYVKTNGLINFIIKSIYNTKNIHKKSISKSRSVKGEIVRESYTKEYYNIDKKESGAIHNIFEASQKPVSDKIIKDDKNPEEKISSTKSNEEDIVYF